MWSIHELTTAHSIQVIPPLFLTSPGGLIFFSWKIAGPYPCVGVVSAPQSETFFNLLL